MPTCEVCGKPESEWPTINKGNRVCSENCKAKQKDLQDRATAVGMTFLNGPGRKDE
jgi:predicted nucleic acid-binding Zn ribbon protein